MTLPCNVLPVSAFQSTNLNNKIETFTDIGDRIKRHLGYPLITLEIHRDQLFQNIQIAIEYFSKFAGYTQEYLIFDSNIYEKNKGVRLDHLFTLAKAGLSDEQKISNSPPRTGPDFTVVTPDPVYVALSSLPNTLFSASSSLSSVFESGCEELEIVDKNLYTEIVSYNPSLSAVFKQSVSKKVSLQSEETTATEYSNVFDYDIMDYRKVIAVTNFEEGSNQGVNTLFTLEQTLAQQTYFSYALGNFGFDLVSWYALKEWLETREKMLAIKRDIKFDERTQYLQFYPQPRNTRFYGVISCYVERPIRDLIKEQWVYEYALALTMIVIGNVRGKFGNVSLLGGGSLNYTEMRQEGKERKAELEKMLLEGASPGMGSADPPMFVVA
jgi:hypothetical protein